MRFLILRPLTHSELGMFHEYRRQGKEGSKQRAINFDWDVVDRVFPAAKDTDRIDMDLRYDTDSGVRQVKQWLKRQDKNWRLEGNCPKDTCYSFVAPGCLFAMEIDASTNPATGAWAVFPADDTTTTAILADGESSRLMKSAMISLHEDEGERTWRILANARPDLFSKPKAIASPIVTKGKGVRLPPNPARLVGILGSVGHDLPSAVADIVDNSISANATRIAITFDRPDGGNGRWMSIVDNGDGMDGRTLAEAMRIGSESEYEANSLGKYGYGLKGASWSQAKVFTVVSKKDGSPPDHLTWDTADMGDWEAKTNQLEPWEEAATQIEGHGTAVLWKNMKPATGLPPARGLEPHLVEIRFLERHLALVFHRFLEGKAVGRKQVTITINGRAIEPNNPFGHPLAEGYDIKNVRVPNETDHGWVQVQPYLLPSEDELVEFHKDQGPQAVREAQDKIGLYGKRNETQGLFIYRHDRLIKWGGWHQMWETSDEKTKLARVIVNFDAALDDVFKINISKRMVQLSQQLQAEIKQLADAARKDSRKKYLKPKQPLPPVPHLPAGPTLSGGGVSSPVAGGPNTAPAPKGGNPRLPATPPAPSLPKVVVKDVRTGKFLWKVSKGLTGALDLQVSDLNPSLSALVQRIGSDQQAIGLLAAFLGNLDEANVQSALLLEKED